MSIVYFLIGFLVGAFLGNFLGIWLFNHFMDNEPPIEHITDADYSEYLSDSDYRPLP